MKKKEKFTQVYFNEADPVMEIDTHNTNLKHRLTALRGSTPICAGSCPTTARAA